MQKSRYGIHKRKFGGKIFTSNGLANFFTKKADANHLANAERKYAKSRGSVTLARIVKVQGGWRVYLRDEKRRKK